MFIQPSTLRELWLFSFGYIQLSIGMPNPKLATSLANAPLQASKSQDDREVRFLYTLVSHASIPLISIFPQF